jgi:hypothetical protein
MKEPTTSRAITVKIVRGQCKTECVFINQENKLKSTSSLEADGFGDVPLAFGEAPLAFGEAPLAFGEAPLITGLAILLEPQSF